MATDPMQPVLDAEKTIAARAGTREGTALEHRGALAAELIADEMTRVAAEMQVMRGLVALIAAKMR
jgi:hypothetical protein